ncbi:MAG: lactonase family protein [Verrucomicrobiota bacterium]
MKMFQFLPVACICLTALLVVCTSTAAEQTTSANNELLVYFGTYTGAKSKGIYVSRLDVSTGKLAAPELAAETASPSFLAVHPNHRFLYAVGEIDNFSGKKTGAVNAFAMNRTTGKLTLLNQQSSGGPGPCHLVVDGKGKNVLVANYGGGSVEALPVQPDGKMGEASVFIQHKGSSVNRQRQEGPHAHGIYLDAANRFAFVPDLGLDKVLIYRFDATKGSLVPNDPPSGSVKPGAGPRHFALHPNGRFAYVINEINCTVTTFGYDHQRGELKDVQTVSTLPAGQEMRPSYSTAEIAVHPSGKFLYGSNRGHDTIVVFKIDEKTGQLTYVENQSTQGKTPRSFGIDPTGTYLLAANQDSDNVVVFRIDPKTGGLASTGQKIEVGAPVCVVFVPVK